MKKFIAFILLFTLILSLTACDLSAVTDKIPFVSDLLQQKDDAPAPGNSELPDTSADMHPAEDEAPEDSASEQLPPAGEEDMPAEDAPEDTPSVEDTPEDTVSINPQFPESKPYLSLYWDAIKDFKTLVQFRLAEDWEPWSEQPALNATMTETLAAYNDKMLWDNMISELPAHHADTEDAFGYILYDINRDKIPELFWVRQDYSILAVFTVYKEKLCLLAATHSRLPIYISDNGTFYAWGSEGAATDFCELYTLQKGDLQRVFFFACKFADSDNATYLEGVAPSHKFDIQEYSFDLLCQQYPDRIGDFWQSFPIYPLSHVPEEFDGGGEKEPNTNYVPYLQKVKLSDFAIFEGPGYHYEYAGSIDQPGTFTITNEITDPEGITWGRLKSGEGWINLNVARS